MKQPHDSQVGWQLLKRNLDNLSTITADGGYEWWLRQNKLRAEDVKLDIKHRKFGWTAFANNALLDDTTSYKWPNIESRFFALRRRYGELIRTRT